MGESLEIVIRRDASNELLRSIMNMVGETGKSQQEGPRIPWRYPRFRCDGLFRLRGEDLKMKMARQFVKDCGMPIEVVYNKVADVTSNARKFYSDDPDISNQVFTDRLFLGGCFIVQFIFSFLREPENLKMIPTEVVYDIKRDMFVLENQLPFPVLELLLSLRFKEDGEGMKLINDFLDYVRAVPPQQSSFKEVILSFVSKYIWTPPAGQKEMKRSEQAIEDHDQPDHLLERFYRKLINKNKVIDRPADQSLIWYTHHSAKDLQTSGIRFRPNRTNALSSSNQQSLVAYWNFPISP